MSKRLNVLIWLAAIAWATGGAHAQPDPAAQLPKAPPPRAADPATNPPPRASLEAKRFDLDFRGGDPRDLLEAMAGKGVRPNIVIQPDCASGLIPPIKLRDVTAAQVFNAINTLREPEFQDGMFRLVPQQEGEIWALVKTTRLKPDFGGLRQQHGFQNAPQQSGRICKVFNLTPVLEVYNIDDVTTAIKGAWELLGSQEAPDLKFHNDTKLLIVVGASEHLVVVQDVIRELTNNVEAKLGSLPGPKAENAKPAAPKSNPATTNTKQ